MQAFHVSFFVKCFLRLFGVIRFLQQKQTEMNELKIESGFDEIIFWLTRLILILPLENVSLGGTKTILLGKTENVSVDNAGQKN